MTDDLDMLLMDVRKSISDNKLFLKKLLDETVYDEPEDPVENTLLEPDETFEEL